MIYELETYLSQLEIKYYYTTAPVRKIEVTGGTFFECTKCKSATSRIISVFESLHEFCPKCFIKIYKKKKTNAGSRI